MKRVLRGIKRPDFLAESRQRTIWVCLISGVLLMLSLILNLRPLALASAGLMFLYGLLTAILTQRRSVKTWCDKILEPFPDGILLVEKGRISFANACARSHLSGIALQGARLEDFVQAQHPWWLRGDGLGLEDFQTDVWRIQGGVVLDVVSFRPALFDSCLTMVYVSAVQRTHERIANVAHELRTPINAIMGCVQMLEITLPEGDAENRRYVEMIRSNGSQMLRMVNNAVDLSRLGAGRMKPQPVRMDLAERLGVIGQSLGINARKRQISLSLALPGEPVPACVDPDMFERVVLNLLSNALKYTPMGGAVELRLTCEGGWARVAVRDTGVGIAPENLHKVFERYWQADASRVNSSGIGLSLVHSMVEVMGGQIAVSSRLGEGSTFTVTLPRQLELEDAGVSIQSGYDWTDMERTELDIHR